MTDQGLFLWALIAAAVGLLVASYSLRQAFLSWASAGMWLLSGILAYTISGTPATGDWDVYYGYFFVSFGLTAMASYAAFGKRGDSEGLSDKRNNVNITIVDDKRKQVVSVGQGWKDELGEADDQELAAYTDQVRRERTRRNEMREMSGAKRVARLKAAKRLRRFERTGK